MNHLEKTINELIDGSCDNSRSAFVSEKSAKRSHGKSTNSGVLPSVCPMRMIPFRRDLRGKMQLTNDVTRMEIKSPTHIMGSSETRSSTVSYMPLRIPWYAICKIRKSVGKITTTESKVELKKSRYRCFRRDLEGFKYKPGLVLVLLEYSW